MSISGVIEATNCFLDGFFKIVSFDLILNFIYTFNLLNSLKYVNDKQTKTTREILYYNSNNVDRNNMSF